MSLPLRLLDFWGELWLRAFALIGGVTYLLLRVAGWISRAMVGNRVRFGRTALITQMVRVGVMSTGIVMLVSSCIGVILALQMAPPLQEFGQVEQNRQHH